MTIKKDNLIGSTLLEEIKNGNTASFEMLFKQYFPRLLAYAVRFVEDENEARDIVQDCFLTFWEKRNELSSESLSSLLFTMVRNSCLNHLNHQMIVNRYQNNFLKKAIGDEALYHADFLMHTEKKLLFDELKEQIDHVVDSLPDRCRQVFRMSREDGLKNREIAERLQISTTAVEKQITKALAVFTNHFKKNYPVDIFMFILALVQID